MARPFDPAKLEFTGKEASVAEGVLFDPYFGGAAFSVSGNGVLLYQQAAPFSGYSLAMLDRDGKELSALRDPGMYFYPRISPDAKRVAYFSPDLQIGNTNVWVWDLATGNRTRLTFNPAYNRNPVWSPDGRRIAYVSSESGRNTIFLKTLDSLGAEEKRTELPAGVPILTQWTPDGKYLLFDSRAVETSKLQIASVPVEGAAPASTFMESANANIGSGILSADGRWMAYRSTETGKSEVYVTSYPNPGSKLLVSVAGGGGPRWRADGKELFYMAPDRKLMSAELKESGGSLQIVSVHPMFQASMLSTSRGTHFDVTADGSKIVVLRVTAEENTAPMNIVVNWTTELKK
jgi:eukaryotic-like serine/threonine-protein kinase